MGYDEWKESNPLRKYRKENGISQSQLSLEINVSTATIQYWESGSMIPNPFNLEKISVLIKEPDIVKAWSDWYDKRPRLAAA